MWTDRSVVHQGHKIHEPDHHNTYSTTDLISHSRPKMYMTEVIEVIEVQMLLRVTVIPR